MKKALFPTLLLAALLAACGNAASTGSSTSATSTGSTSATSDSSTSATSMATGTGMETSTSMTAGTMTSATDTSMMGTSTATGTGMETSTSMTIGTMTSATDTSMMGTSTMTSGTAMPMMTSTTATSTGMMTGTMTSGTAMPMMTSTTATSTGMMTGTMTSGTAMPMMTSTSMMTGTATVGGNALLAALSADPQFKQLVTALQLTGLDKQLASAGPVTIFAPTDTAFAALPQATLTALLADPTKLATILSYHVAQGRVTAAQVSSATSVPTLEGENITVSASGGTVTLNNAAKVTSTEIDTVDGVVHVIDQVLIPPSVKL